MISIKNCKDGYLYLVTSRAASIGIFNEKTGNFTTEKLYSWGDRFLESHEHYDKGMPYGIIEPIKELEEVPIFANDKETIDYLHYCEFDKYKDIIDIFSRTPVHTLCNNDIGKYFIYIEFNGETQRGKLLNFNNKTETAWIVYKCAGNWDRWKDYTAAATNYNDIRKGI